MTSTRQHCAMIVFFRKLEEVIKCSEWAHAAAVTWWLARWFNFRSLFSHTFPAVSGRWEMNARKIYGQTAWVEMLSARVDENVAAREVEILEEH